MTNKENKILSWSFFIFILFNLLNAIMILTRLFCPYISPYKYTIPQLINSFLGNLSVLGFYMAISLFFKSDKNKIRYLKITTGILNLFIFAACTYFNFYGMMFSLNTINVFGNGDTGGTIDFIIEAIPLLFRSFCFLAFIPLIVYIVLYFVKIKKVLTKDIGIRKPKLAIIMMIVCLISSLSAMGGYDYRVKYENNEANAMYGIQMCGVYNYYFYEGYELVASNFTSINEDEIINSLNEYNKYSLIDNTLIENNEDYSGILKNKNLLLIQLESFNNILLGLEIYDDNQYKEITPNLNKLLKDSIYFNNFYTVVGMGNTSDAEFSVMTGLYPNGEKISIYEYYSNNYDTLAKEFNDMGYNTFSMHANKKLFYNRGDVHPNMYGFKNHYSQENITSNNDTLIHGYLNDLDMLKNAIDKISLSSDPTFAFTVTITNHIPYKIEDNLFLNRKRLISDNKLEKNYINYLEHVNYTDYAIGEAIKYLEEKNLLDDTAIILYGDHCSGIYIEQAIFDNLNIFKNDLNSLEYPTDLVSQKMLIRKYNSNIPLIIYQKDLKADVIENVRSEVDLKRTIANLYGLESKYNFGIDALSSNKTFSYNPRNLDIFIDGAIISAQSGEIYIYDKNYNYNKSFINLLTKNFKEFRLLNNNILKSKIFDYIENN